MVSHFLILSSQFRYVHVNEQQPCFVFRAFDLMQTLDVSASGAAKKGEKLPVYDYNLLSVP